MPGPSLLTALTPRSVFIMIRECKEALLALGVEEVVRRLAERSQDPITQKYLQRIQTKLQQGPPAAAPPRA